MNDKKGIEEELVIKLDSSSFKDQRDRLVTEFGVESDEAEHVQELIRRYIIKKLEKEGVKGWSKDVISSFINVMTTFFIELVKVGEEQRLQRKE